MSTTGLPGEIQYDAYDPMADGLDAAKLRGFLDNLRSIVAGAAERLPAHSEFIAANCAAAKT